MNALTLEAPTFLKVEEAYQLSIDLSGETLHLTWDIAPGYYLYGHAFKISAPNLPNSTALELVIPEGQTKYDEFLEREVTAYYNHIAINTDLGTLDSKNTPIRLKVQSQGCADAGLCYPPQTQHITIEKGIARLEVPNKAALATTNTNTSNHTTVDNNTWVTGIFISALISALLGGIILNLMPCVFPVLSIKALSLTKNHEQPKRQRLHGWSYTAGCVATFVAIAAILFSLRAGGQAIGWGFQLQSPVVIGSLVYLFFLMGLLMLGHIRWPSGLSGVGQSLTEGNRLSSSFFTGMLATIVASPCTAPFMGSALGVAITLPTTAGLTIFAALGLGMALPFLALCHFPALSRLLPKPGAWMETFKQLLAFPLLLTAIWLFWIFTRQTGSDQSATLLAGTLALGFALWLSQHNWQSIVSRCIRFFLIVAALFTALQPLLNATPSTTSIASIQSETEAGWEIYNVDRLAQLRKEKTPVFINLTADWCITCLTNEKIALNQPRVIEAFQQAGITRLKGDWTNYNPNITQLLEDYERSGVPLYLMYPANGQTRAVILPQLLTQQSVIDHIKAAITPDDSSFEDIDNK